MAEKTESQKRKEHPMYSGLLKYFPDALEEVSGVSFVGNEQHNPGQPLHWDRTKSTDEDDACVRHLKDRAKGLVFDTDGLRHRAKAAWRALAGLQKELEDERKASVEGSKGERLMRAPGDSYPHVYAPEICERAGCLPVAVSNQKRDLPY